MAWDHRIGRYRTSAWSRHRGLFFQTFCPYKSVIGFIYIVQSELSSNFCANYPVTKIYLVRFFVKKASSCQFQNEKRFCFSNKTSAGEFSCPYKSAILWRHIFEWHEMEPAFYTYMYYLLILCTGYHVYCSRTNADIICNWYCLQTENGNLSYYRGHD